MFNQIFVIQKVGGANVELSQAIIKDIRRIVEKYHPEITVTDRLAMVDENTIAVPCGGDGTVLYAAKMLAALPFEVPIIGFNLGQLGFLTDYSPNMPAIIAFVDMLVGDSKTKFVEDRRTLLTITDEISKTEYLALNDFVISNLYSDSIIKYDLHVGESYAGNHKANGVVISTPTGSTAYAINLGGVIIEPDLDVIEIVSIAGMGMTIRPMIVSGSKEITVNVAAREGQSVSCKADGQECVRYNNVDMSITIKRHEKKVRLLHNEGWNFFELLTNKLNWNMK